MTNEFITSYQGFPVYRDSEQGYYWQESGFFHNLSDCLDSIQAWHTDCAQVFTDQEVYGPSVSDVHPLAA